jgi:hypothetical protein
VPERSAQLPESVRRFGSNQGGKCSNCAMDTAPGRCGRALAANHRCLTEAVTITAPCETAEWIAHPTRGTAGQLNEQGRGRAHGPYGPRAVGPETRTAWFGRRNDERDVNEAEPAGSDRRVPAEEKDSRSVLVCPTLAIRCGLGWRDACGSTRLDNTDRQLDRAVRHAASACLPQRRTTRTPPPATCPACRASDRGTHCKGRFDACGRGRRTTGPLD